MSRENLHVSDYLLIAGESVYLERKGCYSPFADCFEQIGYKLLRKSVGRFL